jgi:hypothetical protein
MTSFMTAFFIPDNISERLANRNNKKDLTMRTVRVLSTHRANDRAAKTKGKTYADERIQRLDKLRDLECQVVDG